MAPTGPHALNPGKDDPLHCSRMAHKHGTQFTIDKTAKEGTDRVL